MQGSIERVEAVIMIGSTTELHNEVPLENFLAMREAVLENPYQGANRLKLQARRPPGWAKTDG